LGVGADADITVYSPDDNYELMFSLPYLVIKGGEVLVEDTEIRKSVVGKTICATPEYDHQRDSSIETWFDDHYSIKSANYGIKPNDFARTIVGSDATPN
jgi:formylmethanofuran dehydrogenase subunit A